MKLFLQVLWRSSRQTGSSHPLLW